MITLDADYVRRHREASPGRHVMLNVSDTGVGMSEEIQDRIFEPFFTTKEVGKGTGLGLATCYGIIRQSGGHMEVDSEPGQGTSFKVCLPVTEEPLETPFKRIDSSIYPPGKETVLLAEDEPLVRSMVATVLRGRGYEVLEASTGEEALRMVQNWRRSSTPLTPTSRCSTPQAIWEPLRPNSTSYPPAPIFWRNPICLTPWQLRCGKYWIARQLSRLIQDHPPPLG